jgi:diguanylate cyclase (GGDEF)-like protein
VHAQPGALAIWNAREDALTISASLGYPRELVEDVRIAPDTGIIGRVFAARKPVLERAAPGSRRLRYATDSYLAVPLLAATGDALAVVALTDRADRRAFQLSDLDCVRSFAAPAALALAGDRLQTSLDELTRAATTDPVTGLLNRRYFETRIEVELQRARRQHQDLALLMVDIDDFKRVNDIYGHLRGDRILREVADLLRGGVRIFDVCARFGGEEFVIVMPGASAQVAEQVAERIRRRVEARSRLDPVPTTVSIGIAMLGFGDSREDLLRAADSALIAAKRAGKNVVQMDAQSCGRA